MDQPDPTGGPADPAQVTPPWPPQAPAWGQPVGGAPGQGTLPASERSPFPQPASAAHLWWALLGLLGGLIGFFTLRDRDRRRAWQVLGLGAAASVVSVGVAIAVTAAAVTGAGVAASALETQGPSGYDPLGSPAYASTEAPTSAAAPSVSTVSSAGLRGYYHESYPAVYTVTYADANGYTSEIRYGFGAVEHYTAGEDPEHDPGSCGIDPQTDGLVPFVVESANTTAGFDQYVRSRLYAGNGLTDLSYATFYSDGPSCEDWSTVSSSMYSSAKGITMRSTNPLASTTYAKVLGYLVIPDFFAPAHPSGDTARASQLAAVSMDFTYSESDSGESGSLDLTGCSGPGAQQDQQAGIGRCVMPFGTVG